MAESKELKRYGGSHDYSTRADDELLKEYPNSQDILAEDGLLKQLTICVSKRKEQTVDKITFISTLQQTRAQWEAELTQMNEQRMLQPGIVGSWSVKDLIAHVSWYEREMVPVIRSHVFTGSEWWELSADERNAMIYQHNRQRPLQEIIQEGRRSYTELLQAVQSLSDEDLNDPHHFREMPEAWVPWQIFAGNSFEHYQDHLPALRTWVTDR